MVEGIEATPLQGWRREEMERWLETTLGERAFRGRQIFAWLHQRGAHSFAEMTDLSKGVRHRLEEALCIAPEPRLEVHTSSDGTAKLALTLSDGAVVETVIIPGKKRVTLCVSSQVGCRRGCRFCRTAELGFTRHLSAHEMVAQVAVAKRYWATHSAERITNLVWMGMGEPMDNLDEVMRALHILLDPMGFDFSRRRVTVSTVGVVPGIARLGAEPGLGVNLALSLNATTDALRSALMPVNRQWDLGALRHALMAYPLEPRQRITIEYVMLQGLNTAKEDALRLVRWLHGLAVKVNLLAWNPFPGREFARPSDDEMSHFQTWLLERGVATSIRCSRGQDSLAACGLLGSPAGKVS